MRRWVDDAMDRIVAHLESLPEQPHRDVAGGAELARSVTEDEPPETGRPPEELFDLLFDRLAPKSFNTAGPGFLAYVPGGGIFSAAVADLIADALNRYVTVFAAAPGLVQLEINVIRWFCRMLGYPPEASGVLTSGGSQANLSALVTARRERLGDDLARGTLYVSSQIHHSVRKAAVLSGLPAANVRRIEADERFRIRVPRLVERIHADRDGGLRPFLIVGSAGTVNTGAVDDLTELARVAREERLWLHVDAAYGGFFVLTERGRRRLAGIERADSVTVDPHKGLFLPYGTGSLLVRDGAALRRAHLLRPAYMLPPEESPERLDFCDMSPELSRDFRGLRVWLSLELHGLAAFREALDEKLDLAAWAADELRRVPELEMVAEPELSLFAFRWRPPGVEGEALDDLNRRLLERINDRQRVFLTGTELDGRFVLRVCVLGFRTHRDRMEMAVEDVRSAIEELRDEAAARG
ncbi:MAG: aminotransferase class I/II-fold pyridoxal phosphate-dependent enzyme [Thermoanaerobaculia bacterium]|nr:aminotransferase class I/II-fold pyridoxal phosphate-dependent enzyme [Thermoanaerobaculia bacterium]